ncbi:MAG TPA: type IX secretion system sortase PorU [Flavisolibacter sp.]
MLIFRNFLLLCAFMVAALPGWGQRTYKPSSVLASGNWFKLAVSEEGVYKIDVPFLTSLGVTGSIPAAQVRLFGNGGGMLPEAAAGPYTDDLVENAIMVVDGGDGQLNGSDYILFYARGPHHWDKDSANRRFRHRKNLYSEQSFYFLTIGGNGKRIGAQTAPPAALTTVNSFNERFFHELDSVNFLSSGKEWYGEEFSSAPGKTLNRSFTLPFADIITSSPVTLSASAAARSVNTPSSIAAGLNNQTVLLLNINPVGTGVYDLFGQQAEETVTFNASQPAGSINFSYTPGSFNSQGWLNWFAFFARRPLALTPGRQLLFRDWNSVGQGSAEFAISTSDAATQVWDVTDPANPVRMLTNFSGGQQRFINDVQRLREYVAFSGTFLSPQAIGHIANQDLHNTSPADYIIITHAPFASEANRLAQFHLQRSNLQAVVVTAEQVYNEFASGTPDPTAIRDYVKMYYDRYNATWSQSGKYLLLVGKASFDYKNRVSNNTNFVPTYESVSSLDPLATYASDDYFGFLDNHEDINSGVVLNLLDIGIGRIASRNLEETRTFVDKVMDYHAPQAFGPWRNNLNIIADDEDYNTHLQDAETFAATIQATAPQVNQQKIYLDAFRQESGSAGGRYPQVNAMVNSNIYNGTLIWNYNGHGGPPRLAEEVVIDQQIVNTWNNQYRLPLFITATCDFAPYDIPTANSLGENLLVRPKTGAIALMTTTRVVFAYSNKIINDNYLRIALQPAPDGRFKSLGESVKETKNYTYQTSGDIANNRKFVLLGDPAMTLAFPQYRVRVTEVNGKPMSSGADTLGATEFVTITGEVTDLNGAVMTGFAGTVYITLFDKPRTITTLGNDPTSVPVTFQSQENMLFKGKATAVQGKFSVQFKVPKDINYQFGNGKISLYAQDGIKDANGFTKEVIIGGIVAGGDTDDEGPSIRAFLNDDKFVNGGITNTAPILILHLADSSGINTGSSGIDHDIVATLDNDNNNYYVLNNFYESDLDNYRKGTVRFQMPTLAPGRHTLRIKAWDVLNNSNEYFLEFTVTEDAELRIDRVMNYPNPFSTNTSFWFEHNRPGIDMYARVEIFTVSGKLIKSLTRTINTPGNRSLEMSWDGRDDYGNKIGRGVYIYRLLVRSADGKTADKWQRLVIL